MVGIEFLQSHALFGGVSDEGMEVIRPLLKEERFGKGDLIVKEGDSGDRLYFICEGSVEVLKDVSSATGDAHRQLAVLVAGDTFGEMELIDIQLRSASVKALEDVSALTLSNRDMHRIYKSNLEVFTMVVMNMAREISRRLRIADAHAGSLLYREQ
jgi:CRP/FNR family cyclic AMP-dependent transcriptional regulator